MEQRLTLVDKNIFPQYAQSSPLLLEANALYFDNIDAQFIAQLKLKNINPKTISAVIVELICFNPFGHEIKKCNYEYDWLSVSKGQIFGVKTAIPLGANKVSKYTVCLKAVAFEDGSVSEFDVPLAYHLLPDSKKQELQGELLEQYKRDLAKKHSKTSVIYQPQAVDGLWQCVCGSWQMEEDNCLMCSITHEELKLAASPELLGNNLIAFREQQETLRKDKIYTDAKRKIAKQDMGRGTVEDLTEAIKLLESIRGWKDANVLIAKCDQYIQDINQKIIAEQKELARKKKFTTIIRSLVACISIAAFFFVIKVVIPNQKYDVAMALMKAGEYEKAITAFTEIKQYEDSSDQIEQCKKNIAYLRNFMVTAGMYVWDTQKDESIKFLSAKDSYSLKDYSKNQALYPVLRVVNISSSTKKVEISASINGRKSTWDKADISTSNTQNFYTSYSTAGSAGTHFITWYIDGIVAATINYTISE